jgi:hypothetical protein
MPADRALRVRAAEAGISDAEWTWLMDWVCRVLADNWRRKQPERRALAALMAGRAPLALPNPLTAEALRKRPRYRGGRSRRNAQGGVVGPAEDEGGAQRPL